MATIPEGDTMRLQVDVSEDIKTRLKVAAAKQNRTMSELAEEALAAYLAKIEKAGK
ncbi:MAG: ribbon-helix-helix protein, CopG family [Tildeniella torsiva UHER 1998/13D]|nr:ribbon-helix-helix protein, CopG family [Tildeniella torsiva UHER 1998/13D]